MLLKSAKKSKYGHKFCSAMHAIRKKYTYNHVHNMASLQTILTELTGANGMRVLKDAPAPDTGMAHSVADLVSFLHGGQWRHHGTSLTSELFEEGHKPHERDPNKDKQPKSQGKQEKNKKKDDNNMPAKNTCPHCKKHPTQEAPLRGPRQMQVEQEIQVIPIQIHL